MKNLKYGMVILAGIIFLTGCGEGTKQGGLGLSTAPVEHIETTWKKMSASNDMKNVEQRDYAMILLVTNGDKGKKYHFELAIAKEKRVGEKSEAEDVSAFDGNGLEDLSTQYELVKGKDLSLSHLKIILLDPEMLQPEKMLELMYHLDESAEIAKTCPVLVVADKEAFLDYMEQAQEPMGSYLSNLVETGRRDGQNVPWLKDYLRAIREGDFLEIYNLEEVFEGWRITRV